MKAEYKRALEERQKFRKTLLRVYFDQLYLSPPSDKFQPSYFDFLQLPEVTKLWQDDRSDVTDESWQNQLQYILNDVKTLLEKLELKLFE